tara:strand:- start:52 stop:324 length:273 start_codon:yes stop_codon:yes gene_type:complete
MKLELEFGTTLCYTPTFIVNGIDADEDDFGEKYDRNPDEAEPYGCGNMTFTRIEATTKVLEKYNITQDEYSKIAEKLEDGLSFGSCGWCV